MKHTILFVAANPHDTDRLALAEECKEIERELRMAPSRDDFSFRSLWAVGVDDLMRALNEQEPAILHFSGHGSGTAGGGAAREGGDPLRDIDEPHPAGIILQDDSRSQHVSETALAMMIASTSPSTRLVVLNACHGAAVAESLRKEVGCVVGMDGSVGDTAARTFAVAFYRALGNRRSVGNAIAQAKAALAAKQHPDAHPVCKTRDGLNADEIFLSSSAKAPRSSPDGQAPRGQATVEPRTSRDELERRLSRLLPSQFEMVVFRAGVPTEHLSGASAAQAIRAIEVIRYCEQRNQLDRLTRILDEVAPRA